MYIYLGTYYHTRYRGTIVVADGEGGIVKLEKKIGKTINLEEREYSLNRTKSPIGYTYLRVWRTGTDTNRIELAVHDLLANSRSEGEWFSDDDDTLVDRVSGFMDRMGYPRVQLDRDTEELVTKINENSTDTVEKRRAHTDLAQRNPDLFTNISNEYLSNNSGSINVSIQIKKRGYNVSLTTTNGEALRDRFRAITSVYGLEDPAVNSKALYVTGIKTEADTIQLFKDVKAAVDSGVFG